MIVSLIWARYFFFVVRSNTSKRFSFLYDFLVAVQILSTYYMLLTHTKPLSVEIFAIALYLFALFIFCWSIATAKELEFAFSDKVGKLITNGPFKIVRHPFYTSYITVWATSTLIFNSSILWITLIGLILFYASSASKEEKLILNSRHADEYSLMKKEIGMFFPKATQWKSWISEKSRKSQS